MLARWGYRLGRDGRHAAAVVACQALLINRSPTLDDLTTGAFDRLHARPAPRRRQLRRRFTRCSEPLLRSATATRLRLARATARTGRSTARPNGRGGSERWHATSPLTPEVRAIIRTTSAQGRAVAGRRAPRDHRPGPVDPADLRRLGRRRRPDGGRRLRPARATTCTAAPGNRVAPRTKAHMLMATRTFFRDCQEWEWIPRRFDPARALAIPRSVGALIGTDPRVIADDVWAKLLRAGLNIEAADLPGHARQAATTRSS